MGRSPSQGGSDWEYTNPNLVSHPGNEEGSVRTNAVGRGKQQADAVVTWAVNEDIHEMLCWGGRDVRLRSWIGGIRELQAHRNNVTYRRGDSVQSRSEPNNHIRQVANRNSSVFIGCVLWRNRNDFQLRTRRLFRLTRFLVLFHPSFKKRVEQTRNPD